MMRRLARLPVRFRVAAGFALAMAIVLIGAGMLIYARVGEDLSRALDQDLRLRAQDVSALLSESNTNLRRQNPGRLIERGESFAQLLDPYGAVLDSTQPIGSYPLIGVSRVRQTLDRGSRFIDTPPVPGLDEPARLLAAPVDRSGRWIVLVVGATRENRAETLRSLREELLIAGPAALLFATGLGYVLAGAGLRTVEAMRARAARISAERPGERLPVPQTGDELRRLAETLNGMLERLESALERQRGFVAEAGHELRTPLALLRAELDYAQHYAETEPELRSAVRTASQETDRLVQLAGDLLLIASADQGQLPLRLESIAATELLESVRERFTWRAEGEGSTISIEAPPTLSLTIDRLRLEQALGNLVDNALRHGGGPITLAAYDTNHQIELHVRDSGPGFPPEFLPRAFQRFSRGTDTRNTPGAGLGLAIVATIAEAHGGRVRANNLDGVGAAVLIILPPTGSNRERFP
jgi:two-component system, OmpR family, sensor kinase